MNVATTFQKTPTSAYGEIFDQFADNASFLWILRSIAVEQPHYSIEEVGELEQRIDAQLDGLMVSIEQSWPICLEALALNEPGEVFTATVLAIKSHDIQKIQVAVEAGLSNDETEKGLISALGWLPARLVNNWIEKFLSSKDFNHKYLAVAACSVRRENPGEALTRILQRDDCKSHQKLYARSLRLVGEIRRLDLMPELELAMQSDQPEIKFWSSWSSVLLGNKSAALNLKPFVFQENIYQQKAIDLSFRVLPVDQARQWIAELGKDGEQARAVIKATGVLGDPHAVNWLIAKMEQPDASRIAAEAFSYITGIDLEQSQLTLKELLTTGQQPDDDPENGDISLDEDENLPWPDLEKIKTIWINHGRNFITGQRYFMGRNITAEMLNDKILAASQRQRHAAALELALVDSGRPLINTRAKVVS